MMNGLYLPFWLWSSAVLMGGIDEMWRWCYCRKEVEKMKIAGRLKKFKKVRCQSCANRFWFGAKVVL